MTVRIHVDGSVRSNPGIGGWGAILEYGEEREQPGVYRHRKEISGGCGITTNNRMELLAVIEALRALTRPCVVEIISDSQYVVRGINVWFPLWKAGGIDAITPKKVMNHDLWQVLYGLSSKHQLYATWVRGHGTEHTENNRAHDLANQAAIAYEQQSPYVQDALAVTEYGRLSVLKKELSLSLT
jgi:ribonuclease HI